MKCPFCRSKDTEVYNTRSTKFATQVWRRRRCRSCAQAFTTYEAPDLSFIKVALPGAKIHPYSRAKLFYSLSEAFGVVRDQESTIDAITATVEAKILDRRQTRFTPSEIAAIVLDTLKHFSMPAYLRYLSSHTGSIPKAELKQALKNTKTT